MEIERDRIYARLNPKNINRLNRIMEGWEYVGSITSLTKKGRIMVRTTPSMYAKTCEILRHLPFDVQIEEDVSRMDEER